MGFIEMMVANKRLNTMSEAFFEKVHRLERLINTNGGVNDNNLKDVVIEIWEIQDALFEIEKRVNMLGYAEQQALLIVWDSKRKYNWTAWDSCAWAFVNEAKSIVNSYKPNYFHEE